jgi:tripartite-type tricarboxylate transporter receptor subunit TctC
VYRLDVSCAGTEAIARAAPDGYTVGMATPGPITVAKGLIPNLEYDPEHDFAPIDPEE